MFDTAGGCFALAGVTPTIAFPMFQLLFDRSLAHGHDGEESMCGRRRRTPGVSGVILGASGAWWMGMLWRWRVFFFFFFFFSRGTVAIKVWRTWLCCGAIAATLPGSPRVLDFGLPVADIDSGVAVPKKA